MKMWWGPRVGRGDFVFGLFTANIAIIAALYFIYDVFSLQFLFGVRSNPLVWGSEPAVLSAMKLAFDSLVVSLCYRRLQDANHLGWYVFVMPVALVMLAMVPFAQGAAGIVGLGLMLVLFVLKPTIGPNRFGLDPRGWKSQDHYDAQQARLKSGDI